MFLIIFLIIWLNKFDFEYKINLKLNIFKNLFSDGGTSNSFGTSILGNIKSGEFQLPRGIPNIFQKSQGGTQTSNLRNTLQRKKDKEV